MAFTYRREGTRFLWGCWTDAAGHEQRGSLETDDEAVAKARVEELERQARGADAPLAAPGELTVEGFARGEWLDLRKVSMPLAWGDDLSRLRHHFFKTFGVRPLAWLATDDGGRAVFSWAVGLKTHKAQRDGKPLASRTVWNIYSTVKVLLDDAVELKRLRTSPLASFRSDKYLPEKKDKVEGWRQSAGFDLEHVVSLTTDKRLLAHRRVWNTLAFLVGGARTGELANLRWRDWTEAHKGGLGRMTIAKAYNSRANEEKDTKTGATKYIPVHPFAARVLRAWHDAGWKEWMGRDPKPEDFIVPRSDGEQWRNWQLLDLFHADLETLSLGKQRQYENRSTFRNLLLQAGAQEFHVNLMTHPSPKQASDFYTRLEMQWPAMCSAICLLDHDSWNAPEPSGPGGKRQLRVVGEVEQRAARSRPEKPAFASKNSAFLNRRPPVRVRLGAPVFQGFSPADGFALPRAVTLPPVVPSLFVLAAELAADREPEKRDEFMRRGLAQAAAV